MNVGNYNIVRTLSEGAFGRTYYAEHAILKTPVCLKQEATGDPMYQRWFREEAKLLWDVCHPSLPTLKDYFESPEQIMVMSFIQGDSLDKVKKDHGAVDDEHICWILQRCLDALSYLHYKGIVHCDIKPQNIILHTREHNAIIVDFGLCTVGPDAYSKPKGGTEYYMPPEFPLGKPPLPAGDIYSLGKVAVYLSGGNPATGTSKLCEPLAALVGRMIRQDPLSRPQDARSLSNEITKIRKQVWGRISTLEEIKFK